jgi:isopentenyldiphosphate isomerase
MSSDRAEELFDIVDEKGRIVGRAPRAACHGDPSLAHRVVHILVFSRAGDLLLQKRGLDKDIQPGKWDTSVGGHLDAGETYGEAVLRELAEELGVAGAAPERLYDYVWRNEIETEHIRVYRLVHDGPFRFQESEIDAIRFWTLAEIEAALGTGVLTPLFEHGWARYEAWRRRRR